MLFNSASVFVYFCTYVFFPSCYHYLVNKDVRTAHYIRGLELMKLIFAVLDV